jgi:hypothetical protein
MSKSRHILAVLAVTAALCADQIVSAAPLPKAPVAEMAARLVIRLSQSFARTASHDVRPEVRRPGTVPELTTWETTSHEPVVAHQAVSPFQFRLPPPSF